MPGDQPRLRSREFAPDATLSPQELRRVVLGGFIENFVERFDYAVNGYLAASIGAAFFPETDKQTALLGTFAVLAVAFIVRRFGRFLWGRKGDRLGRPHISRR